MTLNGAMAIILRIRVRCRRKIVHVCYRISLWVSCS